GSLGVLLGGRARGHGVPGGVGRAVNAGQRELERGAGVGGVQHGDLVVDLRLRDVAVRQAGALVDDVEPDRDRHAGDSTFRVDAAIVLHAQAGGQVVVDA